MGLASRRFKDGLLLTTQYFRLYYLVSAPSRRFAELEKLCTERQV